MNNIQLNLKEPIIELTNLLNNFPENRINIKSLCIKNLEKLDQVLDNEKLILNKTSGKRLRKKVQLIHSNGPDKNIVKILSKRPNPSTEWEENFDLSCFEYLEKQKKIKNFTIKTNISDLFKNSNLDKSELTNYLIEMIKSSLSLKEGSQFENAVAILEKIFNEQSKILNSKSFSLKAFLNRFISSDENKQKFVGYLLQAIFFRDFLFCTPDDIEMKIIESYNLKFYFLQLLSEVISDENLDTALEKLSLKEIIKLIVFVFSQDREGSYFILKGIKRLLNRQSNSACENGILYLLEKLETSEFSHTNLSEDLEPLIKTLFPITEDKILTVLSILEKNKKQQIKEIITTLPNCIKNLISRLENICQEIKDKITPLEKKEADKETKKLMAFTEIKTKIEQFKDCEFTLEKMELFFSIFGLYNHDMPSFARDDSSLRDSSLAHFIKYIMKDNSTKFLYAQAYFISRILSYFDSLNQNPKHLKNGLEHVIYALPTCGKDLSRLPWIPSAVEGLTKVCQFLQDSGYKECILKKYPIVVFDQSSEDLFQKNRLWIESLIQNTGASILHISKEKALSLASLLEMEGLLNTTQEGNFGYGGARNCVYFLGPLLRNWPQLLDMDQSTLIQKKQQIQACFKETTFNKNTVLHMGDDDMELKEVFSDLLFAEEHKSQYFNREATYFGRNTTSVSRSPQNIKIMLKDPRQAYPDGWNSVQGRVPMAASVGKLRFSLLPFGSEDLYAEVEKNYLADFRHPLRHIGGTRYPSIFPSKPFMGLSTHLFKKIPYVAQIEMVDTLAFPKGLSKNIFPWKIENGSQGRLFSSFLEHLTFVAQEETQKEMQVTFLKQLESCIDCYKCLHANCIDEVLNKFYKKTFLNREELEELGKIGDIYRFYQKDAQFLQLFTRQFVNTVKQAVQCDDETWIEKCIEEKINLLNLLQECQLTFEKEHNIKFTEFPLTKGMFQTIRTIGAGEFCHQIRHLLNSLNLMQNNNDL